MIHHISIAANNPKYVAGVLAKVLGGKVYPFPVYPGSYIAVAFDQYGQRLKFFRVIMS